MGNIYTGSNSGKAGLNVKKADNTVDVFGVSQIQLGGNMTLVNNQNGSVTIDSTGGGGSGGVTELSFGSTGFLPATSQTGSIVMTGELNVTSGGTGLASLGTAEQILKVNAGGTALEYATLTEGTGITIAEAAGTITITADNNGTMTNFKIADATPVKQTVDDGNTITFIGGTGLTSVVSATDTVTFELDDTAVTAATYTNATVVVDNQGRITSASSGTAPATGTGTANQVAFWSGASTLTGDAGLTYTISAGVDEVLLLSGSEPKFQVSDNSTTNMISLDPSDPDGGGGLAMFWGTVATPDEYMKIGAYAGGNNFETKSRDFRIFGATGNLYVADESALTTGIGGIYELSSALPTRTLDVGKEDSSTNTVLKILGLTRQSSNNPAVGIGVGMDFVVETTAGNKIGATIEAVTTNVGSGTEAFDFTFNLMAGGVDAAEKMKIASTGAITFNQAYTFPTADGNANDVLTTDGAGNLSFAAGGGSGTPAGANTEIQFNNSGAFGANSGLTYNNSLTPPLLAMGSVVGGVATELRQNAGSIVIGPPLVNTPGGSITSTQSEISLGFNSGVSLANELHGLKLQPTDYQVKTGKTTTQSFGQTQNTIIGTGAAQVVDCYPSQGGLIVVIGNATAITVNLTLGQFTGIASYDSGALPFQNVLPTPPPANTSNLPGYGTWQVGDQVTFLANLTVGQTPNITVRSYNSIQNGSPGAIPSTAATSAPADDPSTATKINGVDSDTASGGGKVINTNFTALTFILCLDQNDPLGVSWVAIG